MKTKLLSSILFLLCCLSLFLSGCTSEEVNGIASAQINDRGELVLTYQNGTEQNLGVVVGKDGNDGADGTNGTDGATVITTDSGNIPVASAKGLRSAVSIVCNYTKTVQNSGFYPGWGGTRTEKYSSGGSGVLYRLDPEEGDAGI